MRRSTNDVPASAMRHDAHPRERVESLRAFAKEMRKNPTPAERALWQQLRTRRCGGYKFRRQHVIEPFIVDFYCVAARLAVEVDGAIHDAVDDATRDATLENEGVRVIRFTNDEVLIRMPEVLAEIVEVARDRVEQLVSPGQYPPAHWE